MLIPWIACGTGEGFVRQVFAVVYVAYTLTTCPYFDNRKFDIRDAGGLQCHFITTVYCVLEIFI